MAWKLQYGPVAGNVRTAMPKSAEKQTKDWRSLRRCMLVTGSTEGMCVVVVVFDRLQRLPGDVSRRP